jgi:acyl-CoA synthetase (AMP-forming)/AMP-acid ligase II
MLVQRLMGWINPQHLVHLAFRFRPASEFIIFQGQRLTRRQVFARVKALAAGLQALGVQKGDRVATLLPGCPEAVYTIFLPSVLGNVNVPLNPLLGEHELRHILADCGAKVVIAAQNWYSQDHPATLARLLPELPDLRRVIVCGTSDGDGETFLPLRDVMSMGKSLHPVKVSADDTVLISYTSGTTGWPKGVVHTQGRYWGLAVRAVNPRLNIRLLRCLLLPFPPYHYAGLLGIVATLLAGGRVILMDRFTPRRMLEYIQTEKVSQIAGSPTMYQWLLRMPGQEQYDLSSVQRVTLSTEPCPPDLARALRERLGCHLENMYGTTESMMISWTGPGDSWERVGRTVGRSVPGARVRIVDDERRPLPAGERGEIAVQTSQMMTGYYRDPELTAQVLDTEDWFYTGDVGTVDEDGYLSLVDRKKDLIIRGGENIYPAEIEQYLENHPLIRRAGVIGVLSRVGGETVWAYVEPQPGATLAAKEVLNFCRGQIAPFKIPAQIRFEERLPTTATGKVQKFKLRELAAKEITAHGST